MEVKRRKVRVVGSRVTSGAPQEEEVTTLKRVKGGFEREELVRSPFFCSCGRPVKDNELGLCSTCGKVVCKECGLEVNDLIYCLNCARKVYGVGEDEYTLLLILSKGGLTIGALAKLAGFQKHYTKLILEKLLAKGYAAKLSLIHI